MQLKSGQLHSFRLVCGILLLVACCLRSASVLFAQEPTLPSKPIFPYLSYEQDQKPSVTSAVSPPVEYDGSFVEIDNLAGAEYNLERLLSAPVSFSVSELPCVLIVHTHATEAYADTETYRSEDCSENVVGIGQELARLLNENGIPTIHDSALHDLAGYDDAYVRTEQAIQATLLEYPSIQMVIDVHRDAVQDSSGGQRPLSCQINGQEAAQLMLVLGTDTSALPHPNWQENLSLAVKLQSLLCQQAPGLMRRLSLRAARYNEHLTPCSILLEAGSAGNSRQEVLRSIESFAQCLSSLLLSQSSP